MKIIPPRPHGYIDYLAIAMLLAAPTLLHFGGIAQTVCYVVAAVYLGMCLLTAYPLGAFKAIPFTVHGAVEAVLALAFAAFPWLLGFADQPVPRNFYLSVAAALVVVWLLTDYKAADYLVRQGTPRRRAA
jgi:uncharacterized YccA/Bax inhibitor family protein